MPVEMNPSSRTWTLSGGNTSYVLGILTVETLRFALQALLGFIFLSSFWYFYVVWCCIFIQYVV